MDRSSVIPGLILESVRAACPLCGGDHTPMLNEKKSPISIGNKNVIVSAIPRLTLESLRVDCPLYKGGR